MTDDDFFPRTDKKREALEFMMPEPNTEGRRHKHYEAAYHDAVAVADRKNARARMVRQRHTAWGKSGLESHYGIKIEKENTKKVYRCHKKKTE